MPYDATSLINSISNGSNGENSFIAYCQERFCLKFDKDWTERQKKLEIFKLFFHGTIYDNLDPWYLEYKGDSYRPLAKRKPCIIYNLPKIIVNDSVSLLFGEGHFPAFRCDDEKVEEYILYITDKCNVAERMLCAANIGAIGSVCIIVRVLDGKIDLDVLSTINLEPIFDQYSPGTLSGLKEKRKVIGEDLRMRGYEIKDEDLKKNFWYIREWTDTEEIYYIPILVGDNREEGLPDKGRSTVHDLGFIPAVWMKNSANSCHYVDGECTFSMAIDISIEINYQLSQLGRMLRYNSDPTMVIKNPSMLNDQELIKGTKPLMLDDDGDAFMLEIKNGSTQAVLDYAKFLRELALEVLRGNRINPDKLSSLHSGKALQMLNSSLVSLVDEMRLCYGNNGLIKVYDMILKIASSGLYELRYGMQFEGNLEKVEESMRLDWPEWYPPTSQDNLQEAQTLTTLTKSGIISRETAITNVADKYGIVDIGEELTYNENNDTNDFKSKN